MYEVIISPAMPEIWEVLSTRQVHGCLVNFDATGYHHLGTGSNDTYTCEISQAHPADLLFIPKFNYI